MKKIKRILAILGAIILAGLYISTIVCALSSNENYMDMLMASVYATVIIPVLIWAYSFYRSSNGTYAFSGMILRYAGRMILSIFTSSSMRCALHPTIRAIAKIGV